MVETRPLEEHQAYLQSKGRGGFERLSGSCDSFALHVEEAVLDSSLKLLGKISIEDLRCPGRDLAD